MKQLARLALTGSLTALALAAIPAVSTATAPPGADGKIVFTSGRGNTDFPSPANGNDNDARIWVADYPGGTPVQVSSTSANVQDRHPSWSPDHTMIVYAEGAPFDPNGSYSIWIKNLVTGSQTQFLPAAPHQDHPVFSPDGKEIAYGSNGDIWVKGLAPGSTPVQITNDPAIEERPFWSSDGSTIYFTRVMSTGPPLNRDIYKKTPVTPTGTETDIVAGSADDWQPAASPDNKRLCWLRGDGVGGSLNSNADIFIGNTDGSDIHAFANVAGTGELDCVWAPDGQSILYTFGIFSAGDMQTKDFFGNFNGLSSMNVTNHFDGNADWATNLSPTCQNQTVRTGVNQFVSIQLSCIDPDFGPGADPPTPTPIDPVFMDLNTQGLKGDIGNLSQDGKVIYTPPKDFKGTDSFGFDGTDGTSFGNGTITIQVGTNPNGTIDNTPPKFSSVKISAKRWRRGTALPHISKTKVGMTISFRLNEAGQVTLGFQKKTVGRRVGGKCRKQTSRNRSKRRCNRFVAAGSIPGLAGKVGLNKVRFEGRLTTRRKLALGTYRLVLSVVDSANNKSKRNGPTFTIVAH